MFWPYDDDAIALYALAERLGTSTSAILQEGTPGVLALSGSALSTIVASDGGRARRWPNGSTGQFNAAMTNGGTGGGVAVLDRAVSNFWTIDALVTKNNTNGVGRIIELYAASGPTLRAGIFVGTNDPGADASAFVQTTGGSTYYSAIAHNWFPKAVEQHLRMVVDYIANQIQIFIGDVGTVPTLKATTSLDGNSCPNDIGLMSIGQSDDLAVRQVRISKIARADAFPTGAPAGPTFTAAFTGGAVVVSFSGAVLDTPALRNPANYVITPSGGAAPLAVVSATPGGSSVTLAVSGDARAGGTYSVALAANTACASPAGGGNLAGSAGFTITAVTLIAASATALSPTQLRVVFSKPVRQVSSSNSDDALHAANYVITSPSGSLTVLSVAHVASDTVDLTTSAEVQTHYTLTVSNVKDIAGNVI